MMVLAKEIHKAGENTWIRLAGLDDHISQSARVHSSFASTHILFLLYLKFQNLFKKVF